MATEILMPALSPTMEEGTLAKWLVKEGESVSSGDLLAEIETDKATMEFEAADDGVLGKILVAEGTANVLVNTPIAILLDDGETSEGLTTTPKAATAPAPPAPEPSSASTPTSVPATPTKPAPATTAGKRIFASPLARRIAADKGIDLKGIKGSGPHGRIVKADVEATDARPTLAPAPTRSADWIAETYGGRDYEELPLDGMRKTIAARLTEAKQTVPHFYLRRDVRLDALLDIRAQINRHLEPNGVKLSVNDFIVKACALALQAVPTANAVWADDRILRMRASDIAVAVAVEGGLFTPVLLDAETKSLSALSAEIKDLAERARNRKLAPNEYQGGSFAVSNLGMFGVESFDAIINPPQGAILAVGTGVRKPVATGKDGEIAIATMMSCTLSVDHRVIDGVLGAELLRAIADNLENPVAMLA